MGMNQIGCSFCGTLIRLMGETGWIRCYKCGNFINITATTSHPLVKAKQRRQTSTPPPEDLTPPPEGLTKAMTAKVWYFSEAPGHESEPVSFAHLQLLALEGVLSPDTLVRKRSEWRWVRAGDVKGLFDQDMSKRVLSD
jgi:hypothetical protein